MLENGRDDVMAEAPLLLRSGCTLDEPVDAESERGTFELDPRTPLTSLQYRSLSLATSR